MKRLTVGLLASAALLATVVAAPGQVRITGAISGTVTDASDSAVPGAMVQLKDEGAPTAHS